MNTEPDECDNCGMIDVPLKNGHCDGCICLNCKRGALDCGSSMNAVGWCDECEERVMGNDPALNDVTQHVVVRVSA